MSADPAALLLRNIRQGGHRGREVPGHFEASMDKESGENVQKKVIDGAMSSVDFTILRLAASGTITAHEFAEIYPDLGLLRHYLAKTQEVLLSMNEKEFASQINDLAVLRMASVQGWD